MGKIDYSSCAQEQLMQLSTGRGNSLCWNWIGKVWRGELQVLQRCFSEPWQRYLCSCPACATFFLCPVAWNSHGWALLPNTCVWQYGPGFRVMDHLHSWDCISSKKLELVPLLFLEQLRRRFHFVAGMEFLYDLQSQRVRVRVSSIDRSHTWNHWPPSLIKRAHMQGFHRLRVVRCAYKGALCLCSYFKCGGRWS